MRRIVPSMVLACAVTASVVALVSAQAPATPAAQPTVTFATDIQPILEKNCLSCHGDAMQMSKFDLRSREAAMSGGAHGMVIVPGNAEASKLYRMVAGVEKPFDLPTPAPPQNIARSACFPRWREPAWIARHTCGY